MNIEIDAHFLIEYCQSGDGPPIVFLHAFPLTYEMWQSQIEMLESNYTVLAPNARGFGSTSEFPTAPIEGEPSVEQMADDLNALLDALDIKEPIILCGLSMGGYTALHFAHKYSHRLRALVLCDTRAEADDDGTKAKREENIKLVSERGTWALAEKMGGMLLGETSRKQNSDLVAQVLQWGSSQQVGALVGALEALRDRPDATSWLPQIAVPTLLVFGEEDPLAPSHVMETLQKGIPNSRLEIIPRAGHLPNLEKPGRFNEVLLEFLASLA